ncbi:MAG: DNA polymerase III subunit gamma/tau [Chitinophagaceae bacterium]|nr:DNA polymerase III subunit gamma/tau [Chitinophagaceae bacterium]
MEKFIVSARKYRPQTFSSVVGQQHITTTLKNSIRNNTLAHAFLFCGPRGVGKTTCARILAKTINCENLQPDGEACNQCPSCVSFNNGSSLNIHELDAASNNSVEDIRELVTQIRFAPQEGKYKIYIIDEVHMLSQAAFNAFLKTLEEPPSYAKFILATTEKHKILPTILSRCQIFDFKRITNADTVEHLQEIAQKEHIQAEKSALQLIAQKSEGCMRDSLSILDKIVSFTDGQLTYQNTLEHLNLLDEDYYFQLLDALTTQDVTSALLLYDQINRKGFEGNTVLEGFAEFLRNLMVSKDAKAAALLDVLEGMQERYAQTAARLSLSYLVSALNVVSEAAMQFRGVHNKRLHVELCLIKLCYLQQAIELMSDASGQVMKKTRVGGPVALKTRPVTPIYGKAPSPSGEAKLEIETPPTIKAAPPANASVPPPAPAPVAPPPQPAPARVAAPPPPAPVPVTAPGNKVSLREKILQERLAQKQQQVPVEVREPVLEEVQELWEKLKAQLKEQSKHGTVTSMNLASVRVEGLSVVITSTTLMNQRFIEMEATEFTEWLRRQFNNPRVHLRFEVDETAQDQPKELEPKYLNATERLKLMVEQYPMVWELKEKLKLDLGY